MNATVHYTSCPACGSADLKKVFSVKDYTVSGESFLIEECNACTLRFTQDVPVENAIGRYYKSEDYISHTNTAKGFVNSLYHRVRKRTLKSKRKLIQEETGSKTGRLLDMGCGTGSFVNEMKQGGWEATGLEPDPDARKVASELYSLDIGDTSRFYQLQAGSFDAITLWHVLEHVHDLHAYIEQLRKLLTTNGKLFIAVPNYTSGDASTYKEYWAAYDVPRHLYHFSPRSMKMLMEKHGLKTVKYKPMWFDSFYVALLSSKYKNGKTNLPSAFLNGLRSNLSAISDVKKCSSVIYILSQ